MPFNSLKVFGLADSGIHGSHQGCHAFGIHGLCDLASSLERAAYDGAVRGLEELAHTRNRPGCLAKSG